MKKTKINKPLRDFNAIDILGNEIYPGQLVAVTRETGKEMAVGIITRLSIGRSLMRNITITAEKSIWDRKLKARKCYFGTTTLGFNEKSVVLIGNPVFHINIKEVAPIIQNAEMLREKYFHSGWKLGEPFVEKINNNGE